MLVFGGTSVEREGESGGLFGCGTNLPAEDQ